MGLLTLISALIATIKDTIKENVENARAEEEWQQYCDIDFDNIDYVVLEGTETAYRIEEEEEFDPVMTDFLTRQDGWQHYETETVQYEIEDGENYCFTIKYKDGTKIHRVFHEDSSMTERLLKYVKKETEKKATVEDIVVSRYIEVLHDSLDLLETTLNPETYFSRYRIALDNAKRILETTNSDYYKTYASKIVTDLTENKPQKYKEFIDRCNREGKLQFYKDKLLSSNYGISLELKDYVRNLLEKKPEPLKERFAVIDFETTGLNHNRHRPPMDEIISVSIIDQDENVLLNTYCDTVRIKSWYEAQRIHGISPQMVKGKPTFVEILPQVIRILSSYDYVISYNVPFEKAFLENYAMRYRPTDFSIFKINWGKDPMQMFMDYMGSRKFLKLETAAEHFGYKYSAHNSLEDTKAALYVYKMLRENNLN